MSGELYRFLTELKKQTGKSEFVFPQSNDWKKGAQARILRAFCISSGLKSIKFHALRATFATLLMSEGVAPATVMKICGWKDLETMQTYIRLAGIDEQGATEPLRLLPEEPDDDESEAQDSAAESDGWESELSCSEQNNRLQVAG